jgi:hypothetical protein
MIIIKKHGHLKIKIIILDNGFKINNKENRSHMDMVSTNLPKIIYNIEDILKMVLWMA